MSGAVGLVEAGDRAARVRHVLFEHLEAHHVAASHVLDLCARAVQLAFQLHTARRLVASLGLSLFAPRLRALEALCRS